MAQILSFESAKKAKQQHKSNPLGFPVIVLPRGSKKAATRAQRAAAVRAKARAAL